ncbi:AraC family transcriptional regulator [Paenibacillus athensensis]|uniref:HTH araC/xylS-type domain-containing protein n=1 Tax=Paenibacillus athensensis TaxID=1967502 RepID=A0A4Y8PRS9_9BACL|nr:helix-turn-helix domain-containing protein [Paenibacillus athensensis]MCD1261194.1 AraC family transcriptional regulator [Paenibacillus athensensis]
MFIQFPPPLRLSAYVDSLLLQEEWSPINYANRSPVKVLPSAMTVIGIQYGEPMSVLADGEAKLLGSSGLTGMQTAPREYVSTGRIGTIIVRFKPGGLTAFTAYPIHEFLDANVDLKLVFPPHAVDEMEQRLREAADAAGRIAAVNRFLLAVCRDKPAVGLPLHIAEQIDQAAGQVSIEHLAAQAFVSKRTLERHFNEAIGISPKKFAGILRFQQAIRLRKAGCSYLDIVEACGYSDHAHFARDFKTFAGCTPEPFFRGESQPELARHFNDYEARASFQAIMYQ